MESYDVVIAGGGPAGITAALYAGRSRLRTIVLESVTPGGWAIITEEIENYPGAGTTRGAELIDTMVEQAKAFGAEFRTGEVTGLGRSGAGIEVAVGDERITAKAVIVATGTAYRKLGVPGEEELAGRGVSYCATCDGPFYRDLDVAVVGGGDSALQEALFLTTFAKKVYLIHRRDEFRAVPILRERVIANEKIECLCSTVVESVLGEKGVEALGIRDLKTDEARELPVSGVFMFVGLEPRTAFLEGVVERDERGFIITDDAMRTSFEGVLAAGDCRVKFLRQVSTAVGDGATAAFAAQRYIEEGEW